MLPSGEPPLLGARAIDGGPDCEDGIDAGHGVDSKGSNHRRALAALVELGFCIGQLEEVAPRLRLMSRST